MIKNDKQLKFSIASVLFGVVVSLVLSFTTFLAFAENRGIENNNLKPKYKINENGQTYGLGIDYDSIESMPDLIAAVGENGEEGYVKTEDLHADMPNNPEEAIAYMEKMLENEKLKISNSREINVYDLDGKTIIDTFIINDSSSEQTYEQYFE